ncbi:glycosyltransferase family 4 protein [Noviherbaspirillum denitrificans]|uniref:Glycosyl transferase n=1 Tax=Noviherbaspirillum denitrificans TaxID=1968433 RepID=A0A254T7D5_9BURK|nr:glycosyltransferase family 4 protein [Noviherbaspirillum denitrificans]OWW18566.1 hypothetical protein AYR66_00710 [Noviherbaspirillum denitrificans]
MKIVCLASSLDSGGAERVLTGLCNAWSARGDEVTLVATYSGGGRPFYQVSDAVELAYLAELVGMRRRTALGYVRRLYALRRLIRARSPDVVVSFLPNVNVATIAATVRLRVPVIVCERTDPTARRARDFWHICSRLTYRFADMLTVQTESVAARAHAIYPGLRAVRVVPNPLPDGVTAYRAGNGNERKVLLSLGRLTREKQVDKTVEAFAQLASRFSDWDLHIYGNGPHQQNLASRIALLGMQDRIFLKGSTGEPWQVMAGADAFVMTSKREGFPNALLEAMSVGLPCVVFDCPSGPREITREGRDALLVRLNDQDALVSALADIMADEDLRCSLGSRAMDSVRARFGQAEIIGLWDRLFHEVGAIQ